MTKMIILIAAFSLSSQLSTATQGAATVGCEKDFTSERDNFKKLIDSGKYDMAYNKLSEYLEACDWIRDNRLYWIKSDLAYAAYKMNDSAKCTTEIKEIEHFQAEYGPDKYSDSPTRKKMTPSRKVLKAIQHNRELCAKLQKK